ncbi:4-hydroxyphenylpyruvate dioxygenase/T-cell reactive protein [Limtongia smithiae]|uniref:4-hydroxyphenylpyruvate dioxygenase/T-cell reactive protein n=1 Tax=Limtongia smithiae TaxID=1125753 RepID=UPI0034CF7B6C
MSEPKSMSATLSTSAPKESSNTKSASTAPISTSAPAISSPIASTGGSASTLANNDAIAPNVASAVPIINKMDVSIMGSLLQAPHHVMFATSNARNMALYHTTRMGFRTIALRELEAGANRGVHVQVVKNGDVIFAFMEPVAPLGQNLEMTAAEHIELKRVTDHLQKHGDSIMDVAFKVTDCKRAWDCAVSNGAVSALEPTILADDNGKAMLATIKTFGDVTHTFIECDKYYGPFLPTYRPVTKSDPFASMPKPITFEAIDHCVGNQDWNQMEGVCKFYRQVLGFHQFVSEDDYNVVTEYSALNTTVMASANDVIKIPITEPAKGKKTSQVEEYIKYNNGPGVQHIALRTPCIVDAITEMKQRGMEFIEVPKTYYADLRTRMETYTGQPIKESMEDIERLNILVDFDKDGYLLQLFVKEHVASRPTVFYEIIQREGSQGFGGGNFKALFESIEREQAKRGNLENTIEAGAAPAKMAGQSRRTRSRN